jgi:predicted phosphodiesterase
MKDHISIGAGGRLLVFGGNYGNLQATQALFAEAETLGIGPDAMLCTGDLAAYCADPQATTRLVRETGVPVVMGNCEDSLASEAQDCGCGYAEGTVCDLLARQWYDFCRAEIDAETKRWMGRLPRRITVEIGGRRLLAVHGGVTRINDFFFPSTPTAEKAAEIDSVGAEGVIAGHSGLPFTQLVGDRLWVNSGALGMPANDGTPRVWCALIEDLGDGLRASLRALTYDHATAAARMRKAGLAAGYADCLESGLWPSLDVLPEAERRRGGQAIAEVDIFWPSDSVIGKRAAL